MPEYRVVTNKRSPCPPGITAFHIDTPANQTPLPGFVLQLRGWIVAESLPAKQIRLLDSTLSSPICVSPLNEARPDVGSAHQLPESAGPCGFHFYLNLLNLPPRAVVALQVEIADGEFVTFAELEIRRPVLQLSADSRRHPILVNSLGRSGSSLLMRLFSLHSEILVRPPHPYESRLAKFYVNQLLQRYGEYLLGESDNPPGNLQAVNMHWLHQELGQDECLFRQYGHEDFNGLARFVTEAIDRAYDRVLDQNTARQSVSRYYAEKSGSGHTARLMMELYPGGHEIFLVRDFRDMYCSMLQFSRQRQSRDFGWQAGRESDYMEFVAGRVEQFCRSFTSRVNTPRALRYEDLLTKPRQVLQELFAEMGLMTAPESLATMIQVFDNRQDDHQTSSNAQASIGRWENELNREQRSQINGLMRQSLQTFGYPV